ncbi:hypothetical protein G6F62_015135 [Rhizopus arrhizus]|nr:hypothetical protein G6F62_015135 [Rhizopus arrhizus]
MEASTLPPSTYSHMPLPCAGKPSANAPSSVATLRSKYTPKPEACALRGSGRRWRLSPRTPRWDSRETARRRTRT